VLVFLFSKLSNLEQNKKFFIESCIVGILIGVAAYLFFAIVVYYSASYQRVIFREIARSSNAVGNLSFIITSVALLIILGLFSIHSTRVTGNPIANLKILFFPESKTGKWLLSISIIIFVFVWAEGTYRKFYIREMVAYYNQLVAIADIPTFSEKQIVKRYFDAKLSQIDSRGQFYAIEKKLKEIIVDSKQNMPKRLRDKFSIGDWKPYDSYLNASFPRNIEMDSSFYVEISEEFKLLYQPTSFTPPIKNNTPK